MRRLYAFVVAAVLASPACAFPAWLVPAPTIDTSNLAAKTDLPPTCPNAPAQDSATGTAGTGTPCTPRSDAARQTQVMPSTAVTLSDGTFSGNWPGTFSAAPTTAFAQAKTTSDPYTCQVGTATTTGYSGKCWKNAQSITLPGIATSLLGLVLAIAPAAPAGVTVMVVGRL